MPRHYLAFDPGLHDQSRIHKKLLNSKKWKDVGPPLRDFRISRFQIPNHNAQQLQNSEKWKDVGPPLWDFGFRDFEISGFQITTHNIRQFPNFQKVKGCGTNTLGFWVSGFQMSNHSIRQFPNSESIRFKSFSCSEEYKRIKVFSKGKSLNSSWTLTKERVVHSEKKQGKQRPPKGVYSQDCFNTGKKKDKGVSKII